ncbi:PEP-CTERM sorting domain-containing protein [Variovorax sp. HJSM1_2]|uniref:PEP-CTERM sorting domain-containing protein n=1 Tax=Variovorax sp. HJSM1_2 TaxID=3366263 RepID=UPI003BE3B6BA
MQVIKHLAVAFSVAACAMTAQATVVTSGTWSGSTIGPFAETDTATYGQTFTAAGNYLNSYTMYLSSGSGTTSFKSYIYAWDGLKIVGSALYSSAVQEFSGAASSPYAFTFDTGALSLTSGTQYVAFFSTSDVDGGDDGRASMPTTAGGNSYDGGRFVFFNNGNDFSRLASSTWETWAGDFDVLFSATFSDTASNNAIPEPGSLALLGLGLAGLAAVRKRKA